MSALQMYANHVDQEEAIISKHAQHLYRFLHFPSTDLDSFPMIPAREKAESIPFISVYNGLSHVFLLPPPTFDLFRLTIRFLSCIYLQQHKDGGRGGGGEDIERVIC